MWYMETLVKYCLTIFIFFSNAMIANALGFIFTEGWRPLFNFKPFNCRPCLTFWFTLWGGCLISGYLGEPLYCLLAAASAFVNYQIINSKIEIYE